MKQINKRAEFNIQSFLITILLFSGIVVTFAQIGVQMSLDYQTVTNATIDDNFIETYDQVTVLAGQTEEIEGQVLDADTGSTDASTDFFGDALNTLKLISKSLGTSKTLMENMASELGVNSYWLTILTTVLILMLLTVIIFMIFRYK